jgi:hypothetical protein
VIRSAITAVAMIVVLAGAAPAARAEQRWTGISREIARPWPSLQNEDGAFSDYVLDLAPGGRDRYGEAMLGYGLIQVGIREHDKRALRSGLRAVTFAALHPATGAIVFYELGLASAYNLARRRAARDPVFRAHREVWEQRLRALRPTFLGTGIPYYNQHLVEAVTFLELARSGLYSDVPGSILSDPALARQTAIDLVNRELPTLAAPYVWKDRVVGRLSTFSDPSLNPLAYHGLTLGFLARAIHLLGRSATPDSRALLRSFARGSWALTAPDGDLAYWGRSQEQAWALTLTSSGAEFAARLPGTRRRDVDRFSALSRLAMSRLRRDYAVSRNGLFLTPALGQNLVTGVRGLDYYAAASPYNGLTLVGLNWALEAVHRSPLAAKTKTRFRTPGSRSIALKSPSVAVVRTRKVWLAVRAGPPSGDLRYDSGLVALKLRSRRGGWLDVLRLRPITAGPLDSVGPLRLEGAGTGLPVAGRLRRTKSGTAILGVRFEDASGKASGGEGAVRYRPRPCGASISLPAGAYEYSVFLPARSRLPRVEARSIRDREIRVSFSRPGTVSFQMGYSSGADADLLRARIRFERDAGKPLTITLCGRD